MNDIDRVIETVTVLKGSTLKLVKSFQESENRLRGAYSHVAGDIEALEKRLDAVDEKLMEIALEINNLTVSLQRTGPELPTMDATSSGVIPGLNLSLETILDVYVSAPMLLEPFARPCSITAQTLNGQIRCVELEIATHSMTWVIEVAQLGWILIPRPGSLKRSHQWQSLQRLFEIRGDKAIPSSLHLLRPALLESVVLGKKWQVILPGILDTSAENPRHSLEERISSVEKRLRILEEDTSH